MSIEQWSFAVKNLLRWLIFMETNSSPSSAVLALLHSCFNTHRSICILFVAPYLRLPIYGLGSTNMPRHHPWPSLPTDLHNRSYDRVLRLTWPLINSLSWAARSCCSPLVTPKSLQQQQKNKIIKCIRAPRHGQAELDTLLMGKLSLYIKPMQRDLISFFFFFPLIKTYLK